MDSQNEVTQKVINETWELHHFKETTSTQDLAREKIQGSNLFDRNIFLADYQLNGRGRKQRKWYSSGEKSLSFSMCLKPTIPMNSISNITLLVAISLYEMLQQFNSKTIHIKWPNDILINNKKLAGILTECVPITSTEYGIIIGIGLNVNQKEEDFPKEIKNIATSLYVENNISYDRLEILGRFISCFEENYSNYLLSGFSAFRERYLKYSNLKNVEVVHILNNIHRKATIEDINSNGELVLKDKNGIFTVLAGEIEYFGKK